MKTLLLSLIAIACLASCSTKSEEEVKYPYVNAPADLISGTSTNRGSIWMVETVRLTPHNKGQANEYVKGDSIRRIEIVAGKIISDKRALKVDKWKVY